MAKNDVHCFLCDRKAKNGNIKDWELPEGGGAVCPECQTHTFTCVVCKRTTPPTYKLRLVGGGWTFKNALGQDAVCCAECNRSLKQISQEEMKMLHRG